jgi:hypothetical protein
MPEPLNAEEIKEVVLQKLQVVTNNVISKRELKGINELTFNTILPATMEAMVIQLYGWVWAQKPERKEVYNVTFLYPNGWWNHLKCDLVERWPKLLKIIGYGKLKEYPIEVNVDVQIFYPELNHYEAGQHLTMVKLVRSKFHFDNLEIENEE